MNWLSFARCDTLQDDEKSSEQDFSNSRSQACGPAAVMAQSFTTLCSSITGTCPPNSDYEGTACESISRPCQPPGKSTDTETKAYQAIPKTYERASRAFSADLQQTPTGMPHHSEWSQHGTEQSHSLGLMNAHYPVLPEQVPLLQPPQHPEMHVPPGLKMERTAQDLNGLHTSPVYMHNMDSAHSTSGMAQAGPGSYTAYNTMGRYPNGDYGFTAPQSFDSQEAVHFSYLPMVPHGNELPMVSMKPQPTRRGPFKDQEARQKTAETRKRGSCIRCRMQRIRVSAAVAQPRSRSPMLTLHSVRDRRGETTRQGRPL